MPQTVNAATYIAVAITEGSPAIAAPAECGDIAIKSHLAAAAAQGGPNAINQAQIFRPLGDRKSRSLKLLPQLNDFFMRYPHIPLALHAGLPLCYRYRDIGRLH